MKPTRLALALSAAPMALPALLLAAQLATKAPTDPKADAAREVVAEAVGLLRRPGAPPLSTLALIEIAKAQAKLGDREAADRTFREAAKVAKAARMSISQQGNSTTYGQSGAWQVGLVAHAQAESGDKAGALETLRMTLDATPDDGQLPHSVLETLAFLAREFSELGAAGEAAPLVKKADAFFETIPRPLPHDLIVPYFAAVHIAGGDVEGAFAILGPVEEARYLIQQNKVVFALTMMIEFLPTADHASARKTLDRLVRELRKIESAETRSSAEMKAIVALTKLGDFDGALTIARGLGAGSMDESAYRNNKCYALWLIATERRAAGDRAGARQTLREARDTARLLHESKGKSGFLHGIASLMIVDDLPGALLCLDDVAQGQQADILKEIGKGQRARGDEAAARATFAKAIDDAASLKQRPTNVRLESTTSPEIRSLVEAEGTAIAGRKIATIQAAAGDFAAAQKTANAIGFPSLRGPALADVARAQAASGDVRGAMAWVRELKGLPQTSPSPLESLILGAAEAVQAKATAPAATPAR